MQESTVQETTIQDSTILGHPVVSQQEWLEARRAPLAREKALTRQQEQRLQATAATEWRNSRGIARR